MVLGLALSGSRWGALFGQTSPILSGDLLRLGRLLAADRCHTDPEIAKRTWQMPMDEMTRTKTGPTFVRNKRAMQDPAFDSIRNLPILERLGVLEAIERIGVRKVGGAVDLKSCTRKAAAESLRLCSRSDLVRGRGSRLRERRTRPPAGGGVGGGMPPETSSGDRISHFFSAALSDT